MRITYQDLYRRLVAKVVDFFPAMGRTRMDSIAANVPLQPKPSRGKHRPRRSQSRKARNAKMRVQKHSRRINWGLV